MTVKQIFIHEFLEALEDYKLALKTGNNIIMASIKLHAAKGFVPKPYHKLVKLAYNETQREKS